MTNTAAAPNRRAKVALLVLTFVTVALLLVPGAPAFALSAPTTVATWIADTVEAFGNAVATIFDALAGIA